MKEIGARLKEERVRLKYTQADFGAVGGVLMNAQSHYERGMRSPNAVYLSALAKIGVDLLYVLTGRRSPEPRGPNCIMESSVRLDTRANEMRSPFSVQCENSGLTASKKNFANSMGSTWTP